MTFLEHESGRNTPVMLAKGTGKRTTNILLHGINQQQTRLSQGRSNILLSPMSSLPADTRPQTPAGQSSQAVPRPQVYSLPTSLSTPVR